MAKKTTKDTTDAPVLTEVQKQARAAAMLHMDGEGVGAMSKADIARAQGKEPKGAPVVGRLDKEGKTKERSPIVITKIEERRFKIGIVGRFGSPFIPHAFTAKAVRQILFGHITGETALQEPKDPLYDAAHALYVDADLLFAMRSNAYKSAMVAALRYVPKVAKVDLQQCVKVLGEYSPVWGMPQARMDATKVGPWGDRKLDLRFRGFFTNWCAELTIEYEPLVISQEAIIHLVQRAGSIGVGDWRPECGGNCGLFDIVDTKAFEDLKQKFGRHGRAELNAENFGIRTLLEEWGLYDIWVEQREKLDAWKGRRPVSEKMARAMKDQAQHEAGIRPAGPSGDDTGTVQALVDAEELIRAAGGKNGEAHHR